MNLRLQELVLPKEEQYAQQWEMFYRGTRAIYNEEDKAIRMSSFSAFDFMTYFNAFSYKKWKTYTNIKWLSLIVDIEGAFRLRLVGYHLDIYNPVRVVLGVYDYSLQNREQIEIVYPESEESLLTFEIETESDCKFYGGFYVGQYDNQDVKEVDLSLVTTTFKKEEFIKYNLKLLQTEILDIDMEMKQHFNIHVIDNGRTLKAEELENENIKIYANKNVGGSGGYARGMIESMKSEKGFSHVLLMDDDVLILPESIKRTYRLLKVLKDEYKDYFISGAMLCYEQKNIQYEDIGFVHNDGSYGPVKERQDYYSIADILRGDQDYLERQHTYAGWWYCCIPMHLIKKNGLPLPLFIRGDDVEFSLRNQAKFITMNGISVWHMGFTYKFNAAMELYQVHRNSLILQAASGVCKNINFMTRMNKLFRSRMLSLDYNGAELILDAIDDFLKGPAFIEEDMGEKIMKEKAAKNEVMQPLQKFKNMYIELGEVYGYPPRKIVHTFLYRLTYNGHRFCPDRFLKNGPGIVAYDWFYSPEHNFWNKRLLAINPHLKTGHMRVLDRQRYHELIKRKKNLFKRYHAEHEMIEMQYREAREYLTSREFWGKYLEI